MDVDPLHLSLSPSINLLRRSSGLALTLIDVVISLSCGLCVPFFVDVIVYLEHIVIEIIALTMALNQILLSVVRLLV